MCSVSPVQSRSFQNIEKPGNFAFDSNSYASKLLKTEINCSEISQFMVNINYSVNQK